MRWISAAALTLHCRTSTAQITLPLNYLNLRDFEIYAQLIKLMVKLGISKIGVRLIRCKKYSYLQCMGFNRIKYEDVHKCNKIIVKRSQNYDRWIEMQWKIHTS